MPRNSTNVVVVPLEPKGVRYEVRTPMVQADVTARVQQRNRNLADAYLNGANVHISPGRGAEVGSSFGTQEKDPVA